MIESKALVLARGVEVPFEIWIVLVICTGGIYLIVALFRRDSDGVVSSRTVEIDLQSLFAEVVAAVLNERSEERLKLVWSKYPVSEELRTQIVLMTNIALKEFFSVEEFNEGTMGKLKDSLVSDGIPENFAAQLLLAISHAVTSARAAHDH
jgi:hypothetical protein